MENGEPIETGIHAVAEPKVLVLVDANDVAANARRFGRKVDFPGLVSYLSRLGSVVEARIYASLPPEKESLARFYEYLGHLGMKVIKKKAKRLPSGEYIHDDIRDRLLMDSMYKVGTLLPNTVVLCSGNSAYVPLVVRLRRYGIKTIIASISQRTSDELHAVANDFLDLGEFLSAGEPLISRIPAPEPEYREAV